MNSIGWRDTYVKSKTAAGKGWSIIRECQDFDSQRANAVSRQMASIGRFYGHPVYVTLLVIEHSLGPDHAGDRVDGEDVVTV